MAVVVSMKRSGRGREAAVLSFFHFKTEKGTGDAGNTEERKIRQESIHGYT